MNLPFVLAESAALELSWASIIGTIITALLGSGGGVKLLWNYWVNREKEKRDAWKKVVDDKDVLIGQKDAELISLRDQKDARIEALGKELSKKSDEHAAKIEELMTLVVTKVESWSGKLQDVLDRSLNVQAAFTAEVREFTDALRELRISQDGGSTGDGRD